MANQSREMVRAFVAGATGYTGQSVVELLLDQDVTVAAHIRPNSTRRAEFTSSFRSQGATVVSCAWDLEAITKELVTLQPDLVFCLIGTTRSRARREGLSGDIYELVDYSLSSILIQAAQACGSQPKFIYLSSMGVAGRAPRSPYLLARYKVERELRESGLPWVAARPSFITGDRVEARPMESAGAAVLNACLSAATVMGASRWASRYRSQTGRELATALVSLAMDPAVTNGAFESDTLVLRHP